MNLRSGYLAVCAGIAFALILAAANTASVSAHGVLNPGAPTPITIHGTITDNGKPMSGLDVVAWCGGLDAFGGWSPTDAHGYFEIHTNSADCHLLAAGFLEIFHQGDTIAFADATIHSQTLVNVELENSHPISVPEFGWLGGVVSLVAGVGAIIYGRRRLVH